MHPSTLDTSLDIKDVTKNLQEDETGIAPMVKYIVFCRSVG
jgi:hypothetical protein